MNLFSKFFKKRQDRSKSQIQIFGGEGPMPKELRELLKKAKADLENDEDEALFLLKDHPGIDQIFEAGHQECAFLNKQISDAKEKANKIKRDCWDQVEAYMKYNGLWPKEIPHKQHIRLGIKNGAMVWLKE